MQHVHACCKTIGTIDKIVIALESRCCCLACSSRVRELLASHGGYIGVIGTIFCATDLLPKLKNRGTVA